MEAKDTILSLKEVFDRPVILKAHIYEPSLGDVLKAQAEISFKAGMEEEKTGGTNSISYLEGVKEGEKLGIKEAVDFFWDYNNLYTGYTDEESFTIPRPKLIAQLKKWGIKGKWGIK